MKSILLFFPCIEINYTRKNTYNIVVRLDSISDIFKKDRDGKYIKSNAELANKILSYMFVNQQLKATTSYDEPFRDGEMASWLLANYPKFIEDYQSNQMNHASKVDRVLKRIKSTIDDLHDLDLIKRQKVEKINGTSDTFSIYNYTFIGYVIALLVELTEPGKRQRASQKLYNVFDSQFRISTSSYAKFYSLLLKKYMQQGVFEEFLNDVFLYRLTLEKEPMTKDNLFASMDLRSFSDPRKATLHAKILIGALEELDPNTRLLLFHDLKLQYHDAMRRGLKAHYADFERHCFEFRERADIVILETKCIRCDRYYLIDWPIMHYIKRSNLSPQIPLHGD